MNKGSSITFFIIIWVEILLGNNDTASLTTSYSLNFYQLFLTSVHLWQGCEHSNLIIGVLERSPPSAAESSWEGTPGQPEMGSCSPPIMLYYSRRLCLVCKSAVNHGPAGPSSRQEPRVQGALIRSASRRGRNKKIICWSSPGATASCN